MKRFYCHCGNEIFFHNLHCLNCGRDLAFDPESQKLHSGVVKIDGYFYPHDEKRHLKPRRFCEHREGAVNCNWLLLTGENKEQCQCIACKTTRIIPDQNQEKNPRRWRTLEKEKRKLFYTLLNLQLLPIEKLSPPFPLLFDFIEDKRTNPFVEQTHVLTGHVNGLITLNAAEADEGFLHTMKEEMGERYRTLLGHFRHEIGHYYWMILVENSSSIDDFREVFGDEREDYQEALNQYYAKGKSSAWIGSFITPYAKSHPHEDWAETWAHYLHVVDTLDTAVSYGISQYRPQKNDFDVWITEWQQVSQVMNALNRSMGMADPYPFVLSNRVLQKLRFIDILVDQTSS